MIKNYVIVLMGQVSLAMMDSKVGGQREINFRHKVTEMFYCFEKWCCLQPQTHTHTPHTHEECDH